MVSFQLSDNCLSNSLPNSTLNGSLSNSGTRTGSPLAAAGRFMASDAFVLGADVGYAISAGEGDGGFYYAPVVAYNISEEIQAGISYRGVSADGGSFSSINLGVNYKIL